MLTMKRYSGFTILELAIALMVLGLVVGGILTWQSSENGPAAIQAKPAG